MPEPNASRLGGKHLPIQFLLSHSFIMFERVQLSQLLGDRPVVWLQPACKLKVSPGLFVTLKAHQSLTTTIEPLDVRRIDFQRGRAMANNRFVLFRLQTTGRQIQFTQTADRQNSVIEF